VQVGKEGKASILYSWCEIMSAYVGGLREAVPGEKGGERSWAVTAGGIQQSKTKTTTERNDRECWNKRHPATDIAGASNARRHNDTGYGTWDR